MRIALILIPTISLIACAMFNVGAARLASAQRDDERVIAQTLDNLHAAASKADFNAYFALFAPDAIFLGTDATERWTVDAFKAYAKPHFDQGKGWTYTLVTGSRHVTMNQDESIAWFDEPLDNAKYGRCRGAGVLRKIDDRWKIAQYNLAFTIPNDVANEVVALVKAKHLDKAGETP